jgi:DNA gyrase/topoisomerase IV subunit A
MTNIKNQNVFDYAEGAMHRYGMDVLEDRAIPAIYDGLKPVHRRILQSAYKSGYRYNKSHVKSARIVGDVLGEFHPHGDSACYSALVKMANQHVKLIDGVGNFGNEVNGDSPASMRYTNARLSKFSEMVLFDSRYLPVTDTIKNYDNKCDEYPLLPALLPVALLVSTAGIAVGVATSAPAFTVKTVGRLVINYLKKGRPPTAQAGKRLQFDLKHGGYVYDDSTTGLSDLHTFGKGGVTFSPDYTYTDTCMQITGIPPNLDVEKAIQKSKDLKLKLDGAEITPVSKVIDDSSKDAKNFIDVSIMIKRGTGEYYEEIENALWNIWKKKVTYCINLQSRKVVNEEVISKFIPSISPAQIIYKWIRERLTLESKACRYWIKEYREEARKLNITILFAMDRQKNKELSLLHKALDSAYPDKIVAKGMKISLEDAKWLMDKPTRSWAKLNVNKLKEKKAQFITKIKGEQFKLKNLKQTVIDKTTELVKEFG